MHVSKYFVLGHIYNILVAFARACRTVRKMACLEEHNNIMEEAYKEAVKGYDEGGVPVGAVMTMDGKIIARLF